MATRSRLLGNGARLVVGFGLTALCFVASSVVVQWADWSIEDAAEDITQNAAPSVLQLSTARTQVRHIEVLLQDYVNGVAEGIPTVEQLRRRLEALRVELSSTWRTYATLPDYPTEERLRDQANEALEQAETAVRRTLERSDANDVAGAHQLLEHEAKPAFDALDALLLAGTRINAAEEATLGAQIAALRRRALAMSVVSNLLSVLLAALLAVALWRLFRVDAVRAAERRAELDQFAGRVAHDLLSPLAAVRLNLELMGRLLSPKNPAEEVLKRTERGLGRLVDVVDGLLAFARASAPPASGECEPATILPDLIEQLSPVAREQGCRLVLEPLAPGRVRASVGVVISLATNLLSNAFHHAPRSTVRVRVLAGRARLRVEVEDGGPGVPAGDTQVIFQPYVRGRDARAVGLGLGLATVLRLARAHGGNVGILPATPQGSIFWFELPTA